MQSRKLEGNCSNPTAINVCKRRLLTCCHYHPIIVYLASSLTNHRTGKFITPTDTTCGHFITPTDTTCGPTLGKSRFCLVYTIYIYCIYARTTMMPPRVLASGPKPWGAIKVQKLVLKERWLLLECFLQCLLQNQNTNYYF